MSNNMSKAERLTALRDGLQRVSKAPIPLIVQLSTRVQDMRRRGLEPELYALVITNDEALEIARSGQQANALPVGAAVWLHEVLATGEGWRLSGKINFHGFQLCVKRDD